MNKIVTFFAFNLLILGFGHVLQSQTTLKTDSIAMGPSYANEVYYSMKNGVVQTTPRATWDIAFRTRKWSSSVITNDGAGVVLYTYPKSDTTGWNALDTAGLSGWTAMYNDPTDWENGAFSRNATGHPDYGWGKYNDVTHNITGDSLYVIKLRDASFMKLWIIRKYSAANIYTFRFANLDGTDQINVTYDLNSKTSMDFAGYSLKTNEMVDFEPAKASWDIVFTKYMSVQPNGTPYPVTGVLSNDSLGVERFHPVALTFDDFGAGKWDSTRSTIGWNWKVFDNQSFAYKVVDSLVFFVNPVRGDIYKIYFTGFAGSSTGKVTFKTGKVAGAGISDPVSAKLDLNVFPNPASGKVNISVTGKPGQELTFVLTDLSGRQLRADRPSMQTDGLYVHSMDVTGLQPGVYFVTAFNAAIKSVAKVIITR